MSLENFGPDSDFMLKQEELLKSLRNQIINSGRLQSTEDLAISEEDLSDETDLASSVINQEVSFNMRHRDLDKLRKINLALQRLKNKSYGHCDECNEFIGEKRLQNQPWADLCITHAEEKERENLLYFRAAK